MGDDIKYKIKELFRKADLDGDGYISREELLICFEFLGEWTSEEFEELFQAADANGDNKLSYDEFVEWVMCEASDGEKEAFIKPEVADTPESAASEVGESEDCNSDWYDEVEEEEWKDCGQKPVEAPFGGSELAPPEPEDASMFVDQDFPAARASVGATEGDTASRCVGEAASDWVRLGAFVGGGGCLFKDICPCDVKQGAIRNCWLLASIASVCSYPAWIMEMFHQTPEMRRDGKYIVRLYHPGKKEFQYVTVSDEVPAADGKPYFASITEEHEIFPCLVEKAFAKLVRSYSALEAGFATWGMVYLCGGEGETWGKQADGQWARSVCLWQGSDSDLIDRDACEGFDEKNGAGDFLCTDRLWKALHAYAANDFPMGCAIDVQQEDMKGLIPGHAYSVIAAREIHTHCGKVLKMVKVRNPHGDTEWTGKWSDSSDIWARHPNVRKELMFKQIDDGSFWMSFHDFVIYFDSLSVNKRSMPLAGCHEDKLRACVKARR